MLRSVFTFVPLLQSRERTGLDFGQFQGRQQGSGASVCSGVGKVEILFGVGNRSFGLIKLVFGVQQIQQGTLTDVELQPVRIARLLDRHFVLIQITQLLFDLAGIVVGNQQGLPDVPAGFVTQILGHIELLGKLAFSGLVTEAVEQVPGHDHLGHRRVRTA